jgi:hypothetical protein
MKTQTSKILVILAIMCFVLLLNGCPADTTQNNQANNSATDNQANNSMSDNENNASGEETLIPKCTSVNAGDIQNIINNNLSASLKKQFDDKSIEYEFAGDSPANYALIFKGSLKGDGSNLLDLLENFNKVRGKNCIKNLTFVGKGGIGNFEWNYDSASPAPEPTSDCKKDIEDVIDKSLIKGQLNVNLTYNFNPKSKELTFKGYIGDPESKDYFYKLIDKLKKYMSSGCISKIILTKSGTTGKDKESMSEGFDWGLCEYPLCDSAGGCAPCNRKSSSEETKDKTESESDGKMEKSDSK